MAKRHHSRREEPASSVIACPRKAFRIPGTLADGTGNIPGIIVYVMSGSNTLMKTLRHFCEKNGIAFPDSPVWESADGQGDAYEVRGAPEDLEKLTSHAYVLDWHEIINARPPRGAVGSGVETPRSKAASRFQTLGKAAKRAELERERRKLLSPGQRAIVEADERYEVQAVDAAIVAERRAAKQAATLA